MNDERLDQAVADEIRTRLIREVVRDREAVRPARRPAPVHPWRTRLTVAFTTVAVVAGTAAVLVAVQPHRTAAPAAPTSAPSPTSTPSAGLFGGDCGAVLSRSEVAAFTGSTVQKPINRTRADLPLLDSGVGALAALGGLRCDWNSGRDTDQSGLVLEFAPVPLATEADLAAEPYCFASSSGGPDQTSCTFTFSLGAFWGTGQLTTAREDASATTAAIGRLLARLDAVNDNGDVVPKIGSLARVPSTAWATTTVDCAALVKAADLAEVLHTPGLTGEDGNGGSERPAGEVQAERYLGTLRCIAETPDGTGGSLPFTAQPAATGLEAALRAVEGAQSLTVAGHPAVITRTTAGGITASVLTVFDGVNALRVGVDQYPVDHVERTVAPLIAELNRHRVG